MRKFFTATQEPDAPVSLPIQRWRESFLRGMMLAATVLGAIALGAAYLTDTSAVSLAVYSILYLILLAATFLSLAYVHRAFIFLFLLFTVALNSLIDLGIGAGTPRMFLLCLVILGGLLLSSRVSIYAFVLSVSSILFVGWLTVNGQIPSTENSTFAEWLSSGATFMLIAGVLMIGLNSFHREFDHAQEIRQDAIHKLESERSQLEDRVAVRTQELAQKTDHLRASTSIARISVQIEDTAELMNTVTSLTAERFGLSHAGIFLLDERKKIAFLQAASSPIGKDLISRGYHVEVDRRSAITSVVEQGRYQFISENPDSRLGSDVDFPFTRSRLILPLNARGSIIGAMDLHSEQAQMFSPEDAEILQSLADLIAISIENVRLLNETRALVSQLESLTAFQSQEAWQKFSSRRSPSYQYTPSGVRPIYAALTKHDADALHIPLSLRGQKIGAITLRRKDNSSAWTERERDLLDKIAAQVALALDNSRLVEEAQKNAQRDQLIASVSTRVRETLDVDVVVKTAAAELRRIFDLKEAEVSLGSLTPTSPLANPTDGKPPRRAKSN